MKCPHCQQHLAFQEVWDNGVCGASPQQLRAKERTIENELLTIPGAIHLIKVELATWIAGYDQAHDDKIFYCREDLIRLDIRLSKTKQALKVVQMEIAK